MARVIKEQEHLARRNEILDSAMRILYSKGFDQMTIQDILDDLKISKGAFYHYFDSKADIQQALIERMVNEGVGPMLEGIASNPDLTALEKLHRYFDASASWKSARKELMLSLLAVWYSDDNAVFRQKMFDFALRQITPILGRIVRQGVQEGVFNTPYPEQFSQMIVYIMQGLSENIIELLMKADQIQQDDPCLLKTLADFSAAASDAIERVLGAPPGTIHVVEPEMLKTWFKS